MLYAALLIEKYWQKELFRLDKIVWMFSVMWLHCLHHRPLILNVLYVQIYSVKDRIDFSSLQKVCSMIHITSRTVWTLLNVPTSGTRCLFDVFPTAADYSDLKHRFHKMSHSYTIHIHSTIVFKYCCHCYV